MSKKDLGWSLLIVLIKQCTLLHSFTQSPVSLGKATSTPQSKSQMSDPDIKASWDQTLYDQLHDIAQRALNRESPGHLLQTTLLVHDAYLKLLEQKNIDPSHRTQVLSAGATIIRRLLVDYARKRKAQRRGGGPSQKISLHVSITDRANHLDAVELNEAIELLESKNLRAAKVVELKFFGGLTAEEIAEELTVSLRTVQNDWRFAKAWLYDVMRPE